MAVYLTLIVMVITLALFANRQRYINYSLERRQSNYMDRQQALNLWIAAAIFTLLAGVSACRIAVGIDYWKYVEQFQLVMQGRKVSFEWGFNLVALLIQSLLGQDKLGYLTVFAVFSLITVFFFVKALYDQGEWFAMSVFLLMMSGYYFSSLNNVRYYFVLSIAFYSMKLVLRGEYGKFLLCIMAAAFFHKSVLIVIPIYIGVKWLANQKRGKFFYLLAIVFSASCILLQDVYRELIFRFYPHYRDSVFDMGNISIINIAKCVGVLLLAVMFYKSAIRDVEQNRFYLYLNVVGLILYTFGTFIPEISRIGYYLIISQVFLIPGILIRIENKCFRYFCVTGVVVAFMVYFGVYLYRADTDIRILPYFNWIFH